MTTEQTQKMLKENWQEFQLAMKQGNENLMQTIALKIQNGYEALGMEIPTLATLVYLAKNLMKLQGITSTQRNCMQCNAGFGKPFLCNDCQWKIQEVVRKQNETIKQLRAD